MLILLKRFFTLIITIWLMTILTFLLFELIPGDAAVARLGRDVNKERLENLREEMGLNRPVIERYQDWALNALVGDFGESSQYKGNSAFSLLRKRIPATVTLTTLSFLIMVAISIPLGILSAKHAYTWVDVAIQSASKFSMAIPSFFLGILITYFFGLVLRWFRPGGYVAPDENFFGCIRYMTFPALAIALPRAAMVAKFLRTSVLGEVHKDYVRTAYAKGATADRVFYGHILRNAMIPVVTYLALLVVEILAGSIVVEQVFDIPGMGKLLVGAIANRDYSVVQASVLWITVTVVVLNFAVDVMYHLLDPRVEV